jgi:hypothetical protein
VKMILGGLAALAIAGGIAAAPAHADEINYVYVGQPCSRSEYNDIRATPNGAARCVFDPYIGYVWTPVYG